MRGFFFVILGPDGVGKSTTCSNVAERCKDSFGACWHFHWRPGLLPKLSRGAGDGGAVANPPSDRSKYTGAVSLLRFLYYWLDFVLGYWLVVYPKLARSTLVIGERYFPDVLVQPERYGFAVPRWLMRLAARLVPKPDLTVLLSADGNVIHARKPELAPEHIAVLLKAYEAELPHWGRSQIIPTAGGAGTVADALTSMIRGARTWRAFPSAGRVKVWVDGRESLGSALRLYQPTSLAGRMAKALAATCPRPLVPLLFRGRPDAATQGRLDNAAAAIADILGGDVWALSISPGTAGHHRKMTVQVCGRSGVIAYAKIADTPATARLLENEGEMLDWLAEKDLGPAVLPSVIRQERKDGFTLLLQGPPPASAQARRLAPDRKDAAFLSALMATERRDCPVEEFFTAVQEPATDLLATLRREVRTAVAVLLPAQEVAVSANHGDYAPWNCLDLVDGRRFVFDWEYGGRDAPILNDLFHLVFMPGRLVQRLPPARLVRRLLTLHGDAILGNAVRCSGVTSAQMPAYVLLYLWQMALRSWRQDGAVSPYIEACLRAGLAVAEGAKQPRNILVAAYACEPGKGSEPGVGWHMCQAIGRANGAWVITKDNNRAPIEAALAAAPNPNLHFSYVGLPRWLTFWKKGPRGVHLYYYLWQFAAWREARRLSRQVQFDLAHHVTFVNDWMFSFLALLPIPFVWGPIGSHPIIPASLTPSLAALLADRLRMTVKSICRLADPLFWLTAHRARLVIGINPEVGREFPLSLLAKRKFVSHPAIGVESEVAPAAVHERRHGLRVLSVGRLIPFKGFHLAIQAFARLATAAPEATLAMVGDGPERERLARLARSLGIERQVTFHGWLPRDEALREMSRANIFLYPSCEGGGMVVLEAMAHSLPVVCLDYGGPGEMVGDNCGIRVPVGSLEQTLAGLEAGLQTLAGDEALRTRSGSAAREHIASSYLWSERKKTLQFWYHSLLLMSESASNE